METMIFVDVLEIAGNLKLCYKVAKLVRTPPDGPGHRFGFKKPFRLKWDPGSLAGRELCARFEKGCFAA